jgi:hypothetical protein
VFRRDLRSSPRGRPVSIVHYHVVALHEALAAIAAKRPGHEATPSPYQRDRPLAPMPAPLGSHAACRSPAVAASWGSTAVSGRRRGGLRQTPEDVDLGPLLSGVGTTIPIPVRGVGLCRPGTAGVPWCLTRTGVAITGRHNFGGIVNPQPVQAGVPHRETFQTLRPRRRPGAVCGNGP